MAPIASPSPARFDFLAKVAVTRIAIRAVPGSDQPVETVGPGAQIDPATPIEMQLGQDAWVIDHRQVAGETWYQVVGGTTYLVGWVPAGAAARPTLTPFEQVDCPSSPADILNVLDSHPMRALSCFGNGSLTLVVYWLTAAQAEIDATCPWSEPRWLLCYEYVNRVGDAARGLAIYGATELAKPLRGQWVSLTGHLDDPRSPACPRSLGTDQGVAADNAATVLFCRTRFVADSTGPASAP